MKTTFRSMKFPLIALVAALAGCSAGKTSAAASESTGDVRSAAEASHFHGRDGRHHAMRGFRGGPDFLIHAALKAPINLTADQKTTIEGLAKHEQKPFDSARAAKLAAAIRSNTVAANDGPNDADRDAHIAEAAAKIQKLHDTLTPEQRTALVDDLAKRAAEHEGREHGQRDGKGEHEHMRGERGEHGEHAGFGGPMHMFEDLDLTQAQKDEIKAKLEAARPAAPTQEQRDAMKAQHEAMRADRKAKLESFKGSTFDAKAFVTPPARPQNAVKHVNPLSIITPILTPAQREKLATKVEQGPKSATVPQTGK